MKDIKLELIDDGDSFIDGSDKYRKILMTGPGDFGMIFSTSLIKVNFSVGNIDIYIPPEIFDSIMDMLGEEYKKHVIKNVTDSTILKIDHKITFIKNEKELLSKLQLREY